MSAYFRKYPSTSCTSERHIPHAFTLTRISSGWMSGTGTSSRTGGLPYSCMRVAFICVSFCCESHSKLPFFSLLMNHFLFLLRGVNQPNQQLLRSVQLKIAVLNLRTIQNGLRPICALLLILLLLKHEFS